MVRQVTCDEASLREFVLDRVFDRLTRVWLSGLSIGCALFGRRRVVFSANGHVGRISIIASDDNAHISLALSNRLEG
jgi:hypothetical protein